MEVFLGCIYCGMRKNQAISDSCYSDLMAGHLIIPKSPADLQRKHFWTMIQSCHWEKYFGGQFDVDC